VISDHYVIIPASVGENNSTSTLKGLNLTVANNGGADLLGPRGDSERRLELTTSALGLLDSRSGQQHVLVGSVTPANDRNVRETWRSNPAHHISVPIRKLT